MEEAWKGLLVAVGALVVGGGGVLWVVRVSVGAIIKQNEALVANMLEGIKGLTEATTINTEATRALANQIHQSFIVRDERDRTLFRQLDRIERDVKENID